MRRRNVWIIVCAAAGAAVLAGGGVAAGMSLAAVPTATAVSDADSGATPDETPATEPTAADESTETTSPIDETIDAASPPSAGVDDDTITDSARSDAVPNEDKTQSDAPEADPYADCPTGLLLGGIVDAHVSLVSGNRYELTVDGAVQNASDDGILLGPKDIPDVIGYDAAGDVTMIELYGHWSNNPRNDFLLAPGDSLKYSTSAPVYSDDLRRTIALYSTPESGSIMAFFNDNAVWDGTGWLACPGPLPPAHQGTEFTFDWNG